MSVLPSPAMPPGGKREGAGAPARIKGEKTYPAGTRLTAAELAEVDAYAAKHGVKRAEAIRRLVAAGLLAG